MIKSGNQAIGDQREEIRSQVLSFDHGTITLNGTDYPLSAVSATAVVIPSKEINPVNEDVLGWSVLIAFGSVISGYIAIKELSFGGFIFCLLVLLMCVFVIRQHFNWHKPADQHGIRFDTQFGESHLIYGSSIKFRDDTMMGLRRARLVPNGNFYADFRTQLFNDHSKNVFYVDARPAAFTKEQAAFIAQSLQPAIDELAIRLQSAGKRADEEALKKLVSEMSSEKPSKSKIKSLWANLKILKEAGELMEAGSKLGEHLATVLNWLT